MTRKVPVQSSGEGVLEEEKEWKKYSNYLKMTLVWEEKRLKKKFLRDEEL